MTKKIDELMQELTISYQELKKTADTMDIEIKNEHDAIDERDAARIKDTICKLKGLDKSNNKNSRRPKIKATPIIKKDNLHHAKNEEKTSTRKLDSDEKEELDNKKKKSSVDSEKKKSVKSKKNPETKKEKTKKEEKSNSKTGNKKEEKSDNKTKQDEYVNAPNKPMRFKKIFDATQAPKHEAKTVSKKNNEKKRK